MRARLTLAAGLCLAALHWLSARRLPVGVFNDDAFFIILSKSLRGGSFSMPDGTPVTDPLPGFPALLALPSWLAEPHWHRLRFVGLAAAGLAVFLTWRLARRVLPAGWALAAALLVALNPALAGLDGLVIPDTPLMALALALFLGAAGLDERIPARAFLIRALLLASGAGLAGLMRPQGALLILGLGLLVGTARGAVWGLAWTAAALAPLGAWLLRNLEAGGTVTGFASNWRSQILLFWSPWDQLRHFCALVSSLFGQGLAAVPGAGWSLAAGFAWLGLAGWGAARLACVRDGRQAPGARLAVAMASYLILVLALHATWPLTETRYVIPLLPFAVILALAALRAPLERRPRAASALLAIQCALCLRFDLAFAARGLAGGKAFQPETMAWLRGREPRSAPVQSMLFHAVALHAGRRALPPDGAARGRDAWLASTLESGAAFVHLSPELSTGEFKFPSLPFLTEPQLEAWVASTPYAAEVYANPAEGTRIFKVHHPRPERFKRAFAACTGADDALASGRPVRDVLKDLAEAARLEPALECAPALLGAIRP